MKKIIIPIFATLFFLSVIFFINKSIDNKDYESHFYELLQIYGQLSLNENLFSIRKIKTNLLRDRIDSIDCILLGNSRIARVDLATLKNNKYFNCNNFVNLFIGDFTLDDFIIFSNILINENFSGNILFNLDPWSFKNDNSYKYRSYYKTDQLVTSNDSNINIFKKLSILFYDNLNYQKLYYSFIKLLYSDVNSKSKKYLLDSDGVLKNNEINNILINKKTGLLTAKKKNFDQNININIFIKNLLNNSPLNKYFFIKIPFYIDNLGSDDREKYYNYLNNYFNNFNNFNNLKIIGSYNPASYISCSRDNYIDSIHPSNSCIKDLLNN